MCGKNCASKCILSFGLALMLSSFFKNGAAIFLVGAAFVILSFALRQR